jgi:hypothetical protein
MSGPQLQEVYDSVRLPAFEGTKLDAIVFRSGTNDTNRIYLNCFPVANSDKTEVWIQKRQGINVTGQTLTATIGNVIANCRYNMAMTQLTDVCVAAIWDGTNSQIRIVQYRPIAQTSLIIGTLTGADQHDEIFLTELNIGGVAYIGVVYHNQDSTNSKAYYAASGSGAFSAGTLTQITDADFPTQLGTPDPLIGPMVQMDGYTFVSTKSGKIYNSDINSISSWSNEVLQATQYPDTLVGLCRFKHFLVAFGSDSIEFYYDAGNAAPGSPLTRTDQAFVKFGCIHPRCYYNLDDKLYFLGRSSSGTNGLWVLDGSLQPRKISSQTEDGTIARATDNMSSTNGARLWPIILNAKKHIMVCCSFLRVGGAASFSFTGDPNSITQAELATGHLAMSVDDEQFWVLDVAWDTTSQIFFPMPAINFELYSSGANINDQYFPGTIVGPNANSSTSKYGQTIFFVQGTVTNATAAGSDWTDINATPAPVTLAIQLSAKDFGNSKPKFISSVTVNQRGLHSQINSAWAWLVWLKNDNIGSDASDITAIKANSQSIALPVHNDRIRFKRLGVGRSWTFLFVCKTLNENFAVRDFDIDISQGLG